MSIFRDIMGKIFGHPAAAGTTPGGIGSVSGSAPNASATTTSAAPGSVTDGTASSAQNVDVQAVLTDMASKNAQQLNWQSSIVDLMKLLNLDSGLGARKELAGELGYTGSTDDSASMNIWLHKQVMQKLAENGGKVPDSLKG